MQQEKTKKNFFYLNGLSLVFLFLFLLTLIGQAYSGWHEHNKFLEGYRQPPQSLGQYLHSGHFIQATFENWESEFLQMALFVILTIFLRQKGSSESKKVDDEIYDHSHLTPKKNSPWPVKKGGIALALYKNSLSIALAFIFLLSFVCHIYGSFIDHQQTELLEGKIPEGFSDFICSSKLWFESFQNWQSEFLSVFAIVFLSIYLRQHGSSQSKPVNAAHDLTGTD